MKATGNKVFEIGRTLLHFENHFFRMGKAFLQVYKSPLQLGKSLLADLRCFLPNNEMLAGLDVIGG